MNGKRKWHHPDGPAFSPGEKWDKGKVTILSTERYGTDKWDVDVFYVYDSSPMTIIRKDAWNFQVRHTHPADEQL